MYYLRRRIDKKYQIAPLEIEDGLSTYDLQLLSLARKRHCRKKIRLEDSDQLLAA